MADSQKIQKQIIYDMLSVVEDTQRNLNNIYQSKEVGLANSHTKLESNVPLSHAEDIIKHNIEMLNVYAHEFARLQMIEQEIDPHSFSWPIAISKLSEDLLKQVAQGSKDVANLLFPKQEVAIA